MKFKIGDQVAITSGKDKGKTGEINKVFPQEAKVTIKGINTYKRHIKSRQGVEGGILTLERPLSVAKIALIDPVSKVPTRIGYKLLPGGKKVRIAKKSGAELDKSEKKSKK